MYIADSRQIREADRITIQQKGISGEQLMETAGKKSADFILSRFPSHNTFLILAGPGNNGGDGLVIARILASAGKKVQLVLSHPESRFTGDALLNWQRLDLQSVELFRWPEAASPTADTVIVDALLGTGIQGEVKDPIHSILEQYRNTVQPIVAIDLPSGLNADTGMVTSIPLKANYTVTFQLTKVCHAVTPACEYCGEVIIADIGIPDDVIQQLGIRRRWTTAKWVRAQHKVREATGHKGSYGHAVFAGGSRGMAGAIALAAYSALHAGAGLSTAFLPGSARAAFYRDTWEAMTVPYGNDDEMELRGSAAEKFLRLVRGKSAAAIGPGMGQSERAYQFLQGVLHQHHLLGCPTVLDADALNLLALDEKLWEKLPGIAILTPHPGEMRRLCKDDDVNDHRIEAAEQLASKRKCTVVLKGARTITALRTGDTWINPTGNPGMGTGGAGDVLTGCLTGLLAQGYRLAEAVPMAVYLHGLAGDMAAETYSEEGVTARRIMENLGPAWKKVLEEDITEFTTI